MPKIYLNGYLDVPEEATERVNIALQDHIRLTQQEEGCEEFDVQLSSTQKGRYNVAEIFSSRESFEAHQARVKNSDWGSVTEGYPRHYTIEEK